MRFETLRERLLKAGIAPWHVRRYLRELDDHLADLTAAQREAGHDQDTARLRARALLGGDDELASAMLAQPGFKSLSARAPWLVFGLLPVMAVIALSAACVLSLILVGRLEGLVGHPEIAAPLWFQLMTHGLAFFANLALGPGVAVLLTWVALRQRIAKAWPLLAMLVIALLGVHVFANFHAPDAERRHIGFGIMPLVGLWTPAKITAPEMAWPFLIIQYVLTLTPALWLLVFARQVEPR